MTFIVHVFSDGIQRIECAATIVAPYANEIWKKKNMRDLLDLLIRILCENIVKRMKIEIFLN